MKCNPSPACPQRGTNESPVSEAGPDCTADEFGRERNVRGGGSYHHRHDHSDGAEEQHVDPTRRLPLPRGCRVRDGIAEAFGHGPTLPLALCLQCVNAVAESIDPTLFAAAVASGRWRITTECRSYYANGFEQWLSRLAGEPHRLLAHRSDCASAQAPDRAVASSDFQKTTLSSFGP